MTTHEEEPDHQETDEATVTVYSRPGCPFSSSLLRGLDDADLPYAMRDIWESEEAAAFVRSVADGHETVPTVAVGATALVNPTARDVLVAVAEEAPELLPDHYEPPRSNKLDRALRRVFGDN